MQRYGRRWFVQKVMTTHRAKHLPRYYQQPNRGANWFLRIWRDTTNINQVSAVGSTPKQFSACSKSLRESGSLLGLAKGPNWLPFPLPQVHYCQSSLQCPVSMIRFCRDLSLLLGTTPTTTDYPNHCDAFDMAKVFQFSSRDIVHEPVISNVLVPQTVITFHISGQLLLLISFLICLSASMGIII